MDREIVSNIISDLKNKISETVIWELVSRSSLFSSWFVNPFVRFLVPIIIDILYDKAALGINWMWIIVENDQELKAAIKTREELQKILASGGDYKEAEDNFDEATDELIRREHDRLPR